MTGRGKNSQKFVSKKYLLSTTVHKAPSFVNWVTIITLYTTLHSYSETLHNINVITQNTILALCEALTLKLICTTNPPNHKETIHTTRYVKEKFTLDELELACQPNNAGECSFLGVHAPLGSVQVSRTPPP